MSGSRLHVLDWLKLDEKILKRLDGWQGSSLGGRLTLINSCLSSIPIYSMSMYLLPKAICKRIDNKEKIFLAGRGLKKKYYLLKWEKIIRPKKKGSLGIQNIRKMNQSLLCRWWWKLEKKEKKMLKKGMSKITALPSWGGRSAIPQSGLTYSRSRRYI